MLERSITQAFAHADVLAWEIARATIDPSVGSVRQAKWNASAVDQMSPPPPWTVQVPAVSDCVPVTPVEPMSAQLHPVGQAPGGGPAGPSVIVSKVPVLSWLVLCDVTARPARIVPVSPRLTLALGMAVQLSPSLDVYAVNVPFDCATSSHAGTTPAVVTCEDDPPCVVRHWTAIPFDGVMNAAKYGEPGSEVARIITPAFAQALVFVWESMRALIAPLPVSGSLKRRKLSDVPQMSPPPPWTVQLLPTTYWAPAGIGAPMSWQVQPVGQRLGGGAADAAAVTVSIVSVARVDAEPELTARPPTIPAVGPNVTLEPMIGDHDTPSGEVNAV